MKRTLYIYLLLIAATSYSQQRPVLDIMLTNYHYPYDVSYYNFKSQHQDIMMAYCLWMPCWHPRNTPAIYGKVEIRRCPAARRAKNLCTRAVSCAPHVCGQTGA